jgi:chemotaxis protein MotB
MQRGILLIIPCAMVVVLSACFPKPQGPTLKAQLEDSQFKISQVERKLQQTVAELKSTEEARFQCAQDLEDLEVQHAYLKNINQKLSENLKVLRLELKKKKSVIDLQEKVIQMLDDTQKTVETSLKDQIAAQEVEVVKGENRLKVILVDKILFDSGSADINPKGKYLLRVLAKSVNENRNQNIVIEGHTDNVSLTAYLMKRFPSNWELSTARASAVARFFEETGEIDPRRITASGYSYHRPVAANDTVEGRRQNRRIEIILEPPE